MPVNCHVPVVVRVTGQPVSLAALGQVLARVVAARLAKAGQVLAERHRDEPVVTPPLVRERYEPSRRVNDDVALVPSYDERGRLVGMPVHTSPAPPPDKRILLEASRYLGIHTDHEFATLRKIVDAYLCTVTYQAFLDLLRRDKIDTFLPRGPRTSLSATLSADTRRMLFGPPPEDPEHWASLGPTDRQLPIVVGDQTRDVLRDRVAVIPGVGDHADRREIVPDYYRLMTQEALRAFLRQMAGGPLTPFEEGLVANWNSLRPQPLFDGPQIVGYYLVSGGSGNRQHRVHDPDGRVVKAWDTEVALVNMGLGPIEYLPALRLGSAFVRGGARLATSAVQSDFARKTALSLTLKAAKPTRAAMQGLDDGLQVPAVGLGRPAPALVVRETATVAPRPAPAPTPVAVPRATPRVEVRTATPAPAPATPAQAPRAPIVSVTVADDESWGNTFDLSLSPVTLAPGQGVVTTAPEVAAGFTQAQVNQFGRLLGNTFDHADIDVLQRLWDSVARPGDAAILTASNSRHLFDLHRDRFWRAVARDQAARKLFTDAGCAFAGGAPFVVVNGRRITITIDHLVERQANPGLALTASNLRLSFSRENSVVLRLLNALGLPWGTQ